MKEWKLKQEIYHRLHKEHEDAQDNFDWELSEDIVNNAVKYFVTDNVGWIWPAKSYMVGICYSKWLSEIYGGRPLEYLDDPELLYNNDPHFKPYSQDPGTYIRILQEIGGWNFNNNIGVVPAVRKYFDLEFGLVEWNLG